jgi:voltage-gated potassium channel
MSIDGGTSGAVSNDAVYGERLAAWRKRTEWPMAAASVIFLIAYAWTEIASLTEAEGRFANIVMWAVWGLFVIEYVVNLVLAKRRWRWFYRHLLDLAVVVLPVFRPLRLLRLVALATAFHRFMGGAARGRVVIYVVSYGSVLVLMSSLAVLGAEKNAPHATIVSFGDALWWAAETISTVGYGDFYPVTVSGRLIATVLMLASLGIIGTVAGTLTSWLVEHVARRETRDERVTQRHIEQLMNELTEIKAMVAEGRTPAPAPVTDGGVTGATP